MKRRSFFVTSAGTPFALMGWLSASMVFSHARAQTQNQTQATDLSETINKAGRLRMLSQRMAKSYFALGQGVLTQQAQRVMTASMVLFERQFHDVKAAATKTAIGVTYIELEAAWRDFKVVLGLSEPNKTNAVAVSTQASKVLALAMRPTNRMNDEI